jgi:adenylosuccinate lyase
LGENELLERLAADPRIGLNREEMESLMAAEERFVGAAPRQVDAVIAEIHALVDETPAARAYAPGEIL